MYNNQMDKSIIQKEDIFFDTLYQKTENNIEEDIFVKFNSEKYDPFFNSDMSLKSSFEENNNQKLSPNKHLNSNNTNSAVNKITKSINNKNELKDNGIKTTKKNLFNLFDFTALSEFQKENQKIKNKISARKSRLKKKLYIEKLKKEYDLMKNELNEIKQKVGINNEKNIISLKEIDDKNNYNICVDKQKLKEEEKSIISNNEKDVKIINSFSSKQKMILEKLLIEQMEIMMPIQIKKFQNKYLKLFDITQNDNISTIKNKIEENIQVLQELYVFDSCKEENNGSNIYQKIPKNKSMAYQIYNYYINLRNYVTEFEKLYSLLI